MVQQTKVSTPHHLLGLRALPARAWAALRAGMAGVGAGSTALSAAGLFGAFLAFMAAVQFATPGLAGVDGYYHIKLAALMRTEGLRLTFDWLPLTILSPAGYSDHHFLYHVLLIPFTFGDLRIGAKLATIVFSAVTFLSFWWLLRGRSVAYAGLWSLGLLAVSEAFLYRMSMPRAQSLSLAMLLLAAHWLLAGKHRRLLPLGFIYVWLYNAFPLLLIVVGAYLVARWISDRSLEWRPLAFAALGIALGLVINPYFPQNVLFALQHILPKIANPTAVAVGNEWYAYTTRQLMENSGLALLVFGGGAVALGISDRKMSTATAMGLILALLTAAMLFNARRFIEYFPAFALLFAAFSLSSLIKASDDQSAVDSQDDLPARRSWVDRLLVKPWFTPSLMIAVLAPALALNLIAARASLAGSDPYARYQAAASWLEAHTPSRALVFQTDWDDFPRLFHFNHHNVYTVGLDPTYLQLADPTRYELWIQITQGQVADPSEVILEEFGARYIFTDLQHGAFLEQARQDPRMIEVFRDEEAAIFQILSTGK